MSWFKEKAKRILTPTQDKKEAPDGLWVKTPSGAVVHQRTLRAHAHVCPDDGYHVRIGSATYFELLFDKGDYTELDTTLRSSDPLQFVDKRSYADRIKESTAKTGLSDAVRTAYGKVNGQDWVLGCMDFQFIGGSMGSVVGERIVRALDYAATHKRPVLMICKSGGARMMEAGFSLMQLPKIIAHLLKLSELRLPYITLLTDPTTGGVTASFGMLGDITLAEPGALIGFAGPRVIRETIGRDLPPHFQTAEFLLEHGFVDRIVDRRHLKQELQAIGQLLVQ